MEALWKKIPEFPQFKDFSLEEKPLLEAAFLRFPPVISEYTFTNLFIWRQAYQVSISRFKGFICLLSNKGEQSFFFPPIGEGDRCEMFRTLLHYLEERGVSPKIVRVPESMLVEIDWARKGMQAELDRDQSDYIYLIKDLVKLEGRRYHRKRNHIKQFKEKYSYQYLPLTPQWISECLRLETDWCDLRHCEAVPGLANESIAIKEALTHFDQLNMKGGVILIDGKLEAFTLGEPLNPETVVIHIEKANPAFEGLYPMVNQTFLEQEWSAYLYVNREQDLGEEGLRKAKESYFPHHMIHKYTITLA
ncbi:MAG: DUF2156 domain-containing protein [Thermodesulfobacteriota bacterium]